MDYEFTDAAYEGTPLKSMDELKALENGDKLFTNSNPDFRKNIPIKSGKDAFFLFSDSYKTAAEGVFDRLNVDRYYASTLCYPYIFLNRQFLELRLKELIVGLQFAAGEEYDFPNSHGLTVLWSEFEKASKLVTDYSIENGFEDVIRLLKEFDSVDPKSYSFRYPVDTSKERKPSLSIGSIDLDHFNSTMKKLYHFFDTESYHVSYFVEMREEYMSEMESMLYQDLVASYRPY